MVSNVYVGKLDITGFDRTAVLDKLSFYDAIVVNAYFLLILATSFLVNKFLFYVL